MTRLTGFCPAARSPSVNIQLLQNSSNIGHGVLQGYFDFLQIFYTHFQKKNPR